MAAHTRSCESTFALLRNRKIYLFSSSARPSGCPPARPADRNNVFTAPTIWGLCCQCRHCFRQTPLKLVGVHHRDGLDACIEGEEEPFGDIRHLRTVLHLEEEIGRSPAVFRCEI